MLEFRTSSIQDELPKVITSQFEHFEAGPNCGRFGKVSLSLHKIAAGQKRT